MRRSILLLIFSFVCIAGIWWLFQYLTIGKLLVTTQDPLANISLSKVATGKNGDREVLKQTHKSLSIRLKKGQYIVMVQGNSVATAQVVNVKPHNTTSYSLNPLNATGVEPVLDDNVYGVVADGTHILYVNTANGQLNQINNQGVIRTLDSTKKFRAAKWADSNYGVSQDDSGRLYQILNGSITSLSTPGTANSKVTFDVSPQRDIYMAIGKDVYIGGLSGFRKIFTSTTDYPQLIAGAGGVTVIADSDQEDSTNSTQPTITNVSKLGKTISRKGGTLIASWSPSGKYLVISGSSGAEILSDTLQRVAIIPQNNIGTARWLSDSTLFYAINDELWSYSSDTQKSQLVSNMPLGATISEISISSNKAYVYLVTHSQSSYQLKRVGLNGQVVSKLVYQLQDIMPLTIDQCKLSLINFTSPTILVDSSVGSAQKLCNQPVKNELQKDGFDLSQLRFSFSS